MTARLARTLAAALLCFFSTKFVHADSEYYHHVFFDSSLTPDSYFYSSSKASAPSRLALLGDKLPVETEAFFTPPNALRLDWNSQPGGGWVAQVEVMVFRNRQIYFYGDTLSFWCFSPHEIPSEDLPAISIADTQQGFSGPLRLGLFSGALPAGRWVNVKIPLRSFAAVSLSPLDSSRLRSIVFSQAAADAVDHVLILDQITVDSSDALASSDSLPAPQGIKAAGFERHID